MSLYAELARFVEKPAPFSVYTTDRLWKDPHIGRQMLRYHLDPDVDAASRRVSTIDATVGWIDARFGLSGKRVLDLGCGPGLYATRMSVSGAKVTGLDFSPVSIAHAREHAPAGATLTYIEGDYLAALPAGPFDLVTVIYGDYCALSPDRRAHLVASIRAVLAPGGHFVFDVYSPGQFAAIAEGLEFGHRLMGGFWAAEDYFGFKRTDVYPAERISLEHFLIAGSSHTFEVFNWMQYFAPSDIDAELQRSDLRALAYLDISTGQRWQESATPFFVVAEAH